MPDDNDESLTQREKRMQRHKASVRREMPKEMARKVVLGGVALLVVGTLAWGIYAVATEGSNCPGHWHGTFRVFVPGPGGQPSMIDMSAPRATNGLPYYDLNGGAGMALDVHMHQSGGESAGNAAVDSAQWHFEKDGICVGVQKALHAVEIDATASQLKVFGAHTQANQAHTWAANATDTLRFWVQSASGKGNWTWSERSFDQVKSYQLKDGESVLVAFGHYDDAQVRQMQAQVPPPVSRANL